MKVYTVLNYCLEDEPRIDFIFSTRLKAQAYIDTHEEHNSFFVLDVRDVK